MRRHPRPLPALLRARPHTRLAILAALTLTMTLVPAADAASAGEADSQAQAFMAALGALQAIDF